MKFEASPPITQRTDAPKQPRKAANKMGCAKISMIFQARSLMANQADEISL